MREPIVDSRLGASEALAQNPAAPCPSEILDELEVIEVEYLSFDHELHLGQLVMHQSVKNDVRAFFGWALELEFPIDKVIPAADPRYGWDDEKLMADNVSSGFNYRLIAGTDRPSLHGQGLAFDINPRQNPYIRYTDEGDVVQPPGAAWRPSLQGVLHADHILVKGMELLGWEWGGHWTRRSGRTDYQHFQKPPRDA